MTVGSEFDDLARALVDDPDVVPRVDTHAVRDEKSIDALADLLEVVAARIELEEARSAVGEQARVSEAYGRIAGSRVDEDLPSGVGRYASDLAEMDIGRHPQWVRHSVERDVRHRRLRVGSRDPHGHHQEQREAFHCLPPAVGFGGCGPRMIFCTRHAVISETNSSLGFRQSISCTVLNSFSCLPAFPNLPTIVPSSSIL